MAIRLAIMVVLTGNLVLSHAPDALGKSGFGWKTLGVLLSVGCLLAIADCIRPVITLRPMLIIDQTGIRLGQRQLAWGEVGEVGVITGWQTLRSLPVIPRDERAKSLSVPQDNVKDLEVFAGWLGEVLAQQRQNDIRS
ncbi:MULTISPECIES: hypothetical protein [Kribbella]|nr:MULTISPECIES: hypothetical protein [Kribbella]